MSDKSSQYRVLLIGAAGNFGSKLAQLLASDPSIHLLLASRTKSALLSLQKNINSGEICLLERETVDSTLLNKLNIDVVADLTGPYHDMSNKLVEAAINAKVHYIDIADSLSYVNSVAQFDEKAKEQNIAILAGASSTPSLSHAVVDKLTTDWQRIDNIEATISPSNGQHYGLSLMQSILSRVGKPFSGFYGGSWRNTTYWSNTRRIAIPKVGNRLCSDVETPDTQLFVSRYNTKMSATFRASLELSIMHRGVAFLSMLVKHKMLKSADRLAPALQWIANRLSVFTNNYGGMMVKVSGQDNVKRPVISQWVLSAKGTSGPHVPVLACLIAIKKLSQNTLNYHGAGPCIGMLSLDEFDSEFAKLDIQTQSQLSILPSPPFMIALGEDFARLPSINQAIHITDPTKLLSGEVTIQGAENLAARFIASLFRMPRSCSESALSTTIELNEDGAETWARYFPDRCMQSRMHNPDPDNQTIDECFGLFCFTLKLDADEQGLNMFLESGKLLGITLPPFFLPKIVATERADGDKHLFDVSIALPLIGRLVHYSGWLRIVH